MPRRAAVLGRPVAHSLSPALWRAAFAADGLDWTYDAIECDEGQLPAVLADCAADPEWAGVSLTMPLKLAAARLLPAADGLGAVNTVVFRDGEMTGHNTDVDGIRAAVATVCAGRPGQVVVLGAGGTARAALSACRQLSPSAVDVVARRPDVVAAELAALGGDPPLRLLPWSRAHAAIAAADLVVATTPAGATDELAFASWPAGAALVDVVYAPWPTRLADAAAAAGAPVAGGLEVLVGQAATAYRLVTGLDAPVAAMRAAGEAALAAR